MKKQKIWHCDGFYYDDVCLQRGDIDPETVRVTRGGRFTEGHYFCKNDGQNPNTEKPCEHCIQNRRLFKHKKPALCTPSRPASLTPYCAKNSGGHAVKCFADLDEFGKYMLAHPEYTAYHINLDINIEPFWLTGVK
jgi:hypothetical protein